MQDRATNGLCVEVMNYWQMTFDEMMSDSFRPKTEPMHQGAWAYVCPVCGNAVGIRRVVEGFVYKRDECKNGHKVDWSEVK